MQEVSSRGETAINLVQLSSHSNSVKSNQHSPLSEIQPADLNLARINHTRSSARDIDWEQLAATPCPSAHMLPQEHFSLGFVKLEAQKQELEEKQLTLFDSVLSMTPLEYQNQTKALEQDRKHFGLRIENHISDQDKKAVSDYAKAPETYAKARALFQAEKKVLLEIKKPSQSALTNKDNTLSLGDTPDKRFTKAKWDLHLAFDALLAAKEGYEAQELTLQNDRQEYAQAYEQLQEVGHEFFTLEQDVKDMMVQKRLAVLNESALREPAQTSATELKLKTRIDAFLTKDKKEVQEGRDGLGLMMAKGLKFHARKRDSLLTPKITSTQMMAFEKEHLAKLGADLKQVNDRIEKAKRPEGSLAFKASHLKHKVFTPKNYTDKETDNLTLVQDKALYRSLQSKVAEFKTGVDSRIAKDAALNNLLEKADKVSALMEAIRTQ